MDNLTHSLIGAALGQVGLKRKTGLAMPALIIGANLPDVDAPCVVFGIESLAMRRGITHGPIALILLPLVLAGALVWFDKWQARRGKRPRHRAPVDVKWLIALGYLGTLTHPLFDWFNNYGIRLLEPFSSQWFYGDTLFIIDVWIWAMLGSGLWLSLRRERAGQINPARPALIAMMGMAVYVSANIGISRYVGWKAGMSEPYPEIAVTNALPLTFWKREVLWRSGESYGRYTVTFPFSRAQMEPARSHNMHDPRIAQWLASNPAARAFLFWSRMPIASPDGGAINLRDQRFTDSFGRSNFSVMLTPPKVPQSAR